jgi:hypothetical protein
MMEEKATDIHHTKHLPKISIKYVWDILFVAILPALCFVIDPVLFANGIAGQPIFSEAVQIATYICVAVLILVFFISYLSIKSRILRLLISGALISGATVALALGVILLPLSLFGLIVILGVLGFIPFFTASRFWKRFKEFKMKEIIQPDELMLIFLGCLIPFAPSLFVYKQGTTIRSQIMADLTSKDENRIRKAMVQINNSLFCTKYCTIEVIDNFENGKIKLAEGEFSSLLVNATGIDYRQFVDARIND